MNDRPLDLPAMLILPRQQPLRSARQKAVDALAAQSETQLQWLGAEPCGARWRMPVLDRVFYVELGTGRVCDAEGCEIQLMGQVLTLHYLALRTQPLCQTPTVTFASLKGGQTYATVYENRVNRRLCAGVGRDRRTLLEAAQTLPARPAQGGDVALEVDIFPRIPLRLVWYDGDDELMPCSKLLLPANIELFLCLEDIVVLSELFVARLNRKPL